VVAVLAVAAALSLPSPVANVPSAAAAPAAGPLRLHDVWPSARISTVDGQLAGGDTYQPVFVVDAQTSVGVATSTLGTGRLVVRTGSSVRVLHTLGSAQVAALLVAGDQAYWLESGPDAQGRGTTSVWRAGLRSGPTRRLSEAVSDLIFYDSQYDLELVQDRLYWVAFAGHGRSELRSISVDGGPITVRSLDQEYALTTWPWATTYAGGSTVGDIDMLNLVTGEHRTVKAAANQYLNCTPSWCRVTTLVNHNNDVTVTLEHPDGTHVVGFADHSLSPVNTDVALLDRFEVVESPASVNAANPTDKLWLHDLNTGRDILLDAAASGVIGSRAGTLWWSTGDNEATVWQILDLHQLS
jgi:hypothetical protein